MDDATGWALIESNRRLIVAIGMHWENKSRELKGESPAYTEGAFSNLAYEPF